MKKCGLLHSIWLALLFLALIAGPVFVPLPTTVAQGPPPERPQPPPGGPGAPPGRPQPPEIGQGSTTDSGGVASYFCSDVHGTVIHWGYRNEPKLPVELSGDGWQTQRVTDDNGYYAFTCMGVGISLLNLTPPPGCKPLTEDVAIRLGYREEFEVNLGLYGGEVAPSLDVTPTMTVSDISVPPGGTLTYTIQVANTPGLPSAGRKVENVMITDLLPEYLTPVEVTSTVGTLELWDNLLTADIGELEPGQAVTITVKAVVGEDILPTSVITNRASLIYGGNVTVQTVPITVEVKTTHKP